MFDLADKPIAIFRTKSQILTARDMNNITISDKVIESAVFQSAKMQDTLGFMVVSGSDYSVVDVIGIKNDPRAFLELTFGKS